MSYELFQQGPGVYIPVLLISLAFTLLGYCAFPVIFAKTRDIPITKKKYRWLCYGVNLAVMVLFALFNGGQFHGAPYIFWTWIFSRYGIKVLGTRGVMQDSEYLEDDPNRVTECLSCGYRNPDFFDACPECGELRKRYVYLNQEAPVEEPKICFCRKCGHKLIDDSRFCNKCGTEVVKE